MTTIIEKDSLSIRIINGMNVDKVICSLEEFLLLAKFCKNSKNKKDAIKTFNSLANKLKTLGVSMKKQTNFLQVG